MSKAVLVIDMPRSCEECMFCSAVGECKFLDDVDGSIANGSKDLRCPLKPLIRNEDAISREQFREQMYHRCFEVDNDPNMQKWDSGCWLRWKLFEEELKHAPSVVPTEKIGKWVKVPGYATPGGDPVWECSECGKGRHVYGIEAPSYQKDVSNQQWVTCPNCGARME